MQIRLNERKEGAECLMSNGGGVQMEGGRNDPLLSIPTAWRLEGNTGVSLTAGKQQQVKASLLQLTRPGMALAIGAGQESLEGERVKYKGLELTGKALPRDPGCTSLQPAWAVEGRAFRSGDWKEGDAYAAKACASERGFPREDSQPDPGSSWEWG